MLVSMMILREKLEPIVKSAWGNLSPSSEIPNCIDSYWKYRFLAMEILPNNSKCDQTQPNLKRKKKLFC